MGYRCAGLLVAASALTWPVAAAPAVRSQPTLRVKTFAPFTVVGTHFRASEHVKVTLAGTWVRRAKTTALGRFVVAFKGVGVDVCNGFAVRAVGSRGSVALLRAPPRECPSRNPG
jgi:hypothetical protein